jgi:hypothetical protein
MRGGRFYGASGGQQNRFADAHRALVPEQRVVRPASVTEVLVDVYDPFGVRTHRGASLQHHTCEREAGSGEEVAAGKNVSRLVTMKVTRAHAFSVLRNANGFKSETTPGVRDRRHGGMLSRQIIACA